MQYFFTSIVCTLSVITLGFSQRQTSENVELQTMTISYYGLAKNENKVLNYHKDVNQAFKEILDGRPIEGMLLLKDALYSTRTTLPIDWFMAGFGYAMLNEKQGVDLMLNEAISRDGKLDSLMRTGLPNRLIGGFMGEKAWKVFLDKKRNLKNARPDLTLINTLRELERLELVVVELEMIYKDSILVYHKLDRKIVEKHETLIQAAKNNREKGYAKVIESDAWSLNKLMASGESELYIEYNNEPDWFQKHESQLIALFYNDKILPWELAFMHDWHAKRHGQVQKYALFYGQRLDEKIIMNCEAIGMPWGAVRDARLFYTFPETF